MIDIDETFNELAQYRCSDMFYEIYAPSPNSSWFWIDFQYENPYRFHEFKTAGNEYFERILVREYAFLCPHRRHGDLLLPYYVSKEYHIGISPYPYMPGRFVFKPTARLVDVYLAEEPGTAYTSPDFNVERYYLQIREIDEREPGNVYVTA